MNIVKQVCPSGLGKVVIQPGLMSVPLVLRRLALQLEGDLSKSEFLAGALRLRIHAIENPASREWAAIRTCEARGESSIQDLVGLRAVAAPTERLKVLLGRQAAP